MQEQLQITRNPMLQVSQSAEQFDNHGRKKSSSRTHPHSPQVARTQLEDPTCPYLAISVLDLTFFVRVSAERASSATDIEPNGKRYGQVLPLSDA